MRIGKLLVVMLSLLMIGCAGKHVMPDADYAQAPESVVRIAFDQSGYIYPRKVDLIDWPSFRASWNKDRFGGPFELKEFENINGEKLYGGRLHKESEIAAIRELNTVLKDGDMLVVLIHGFNNDYKKASNYYDLMRSYILRDDAVFLEVYWDGLQPRNKKTLNTTAAATFWRKALTYSNLAGHGGLRPILNGIAKDIDLRFITHSRGVAVALSALSNPVYDSHIRRPGGDEDKKQDLAFLKDDAFNNLHVKSIKIAAFAPAIGDGHLHDRLDSDLNGYSAQLYLGTNAEDIANSKWVLPSGFWGDTSLGGNLDYLKYELSRPRKNIKLFRAEFTHGKKHGLEHYFSGNPELTECVYNAIDLSPKMAPTCRFIEGGDGL